MKPALSATEPTGQKLSNSDHKQRIGGNHQVERRLFEKWMRWFIRKVAEELIVRYFHTESVICPLGSSFLTSNY